VISWDDFARLAGAPVTVTVRGRVWSTDAAAAERVTFAPPDFWRVEDEGGRLRYLANDDGHYQWPAEGGPVSCFQPRRPGDRYSGDTAGAYLIRPRELVRPDDDDFTRPAGPVEELLFLDRPAWRVLLTPPPRKPQPVWPVLDVASGVTLAYETVDGTNVVEFTSIVIDIEVTPETFMTPIDGPSK
jgi:hypothetical protein